jgi:hypothetical protein
MFYAFFWVIPRRLKFNFKSRGITQKKAYNIVQLVVSKYSDIPTMHGQQNIKHNNSNNLIY